MRPAPFDRDLMMRAAADGAMLLFARTSVAMVRAADDEDEDGPSGKLGVTPVIASTATPDRYGDVVVQQGWELASFKANPVIMPFHNYNSPPVGRGEGVGLVEHSSGDALGMTIKWDQGFELGATLARQYHEGFMQGVSVGFRPIQYVERSKLADNHPSKAESGFYIEKSELLELSAAPVPVQQEALALRSLPDAYQPGLVAQLTLDDADAGVLRALRNALRNDPETQRAVRHLVRAMRLAEPESKTYRDAADWLAS